MEKNFFINSARVVGDAPLTEVPLMMVILSVFDWENKNGEGMVFSAAATISDPLTRWALTATNPVGGECGRECPFEFVGTGPLPLTSRYAGLNDRGCRCVYAACRVASFSRRLTMAVRRFFRRWFSCRARADTASKVSLAL